MVTAKNKRNPLVRSGANFGWKIDCYDGCEHGCRYCYAWGIKRKKHKYYSSWTNPIPVQNVVSDLQSQLSGMKNTTKANIKDIFVSSLTDCYQPIESQHRITRQVIKLLIENELPFTILTKSATVLDDIDLFKNYDKCRVGFTIVTLDDNLRQSLEPNASSIADRIEALKELRQAGISTYCSVEPILPDKRSDPIAIVDKLKDYVDLWEFGMWNPKDDSKRLVEKILGTVYNEYYYLNVFNNIKEYCDKNKINYCHAGHSEKFLKECGITFKPCPLVRKEVRKLIQ